MTRVRQIFVDRDAMGAYERDMPDSDYGEFFLLLEPRGLYIGDPRGMVRVG